MMRSGRITRRLLTSALCQKQTPAQLCREGTAIRGSSCGETSAAPRRLDRGDVDLLHSHHRIKRALCKLNPKSALAYCNLGWTYEAMNDERKAIAHYRKALEIDPSLETARDNLTLLGAAPEH
jgi:tetratricopeptide (TPR) repeat protein